MNVANQPKPKRRSCQVKPCTVLLGLLVLTGCGPSKEQRAIDAYSRGDAHFDKGELDEAIADYTEAIRLKPEFAEAHDNRGAAYAGQGEFDKAVSDHTEAMCLRPDLANAYYNRGVAYGEKEELAKAIADYTEAIRLNPQKVASYAIPLRFFAICERC